MACGTGCCYLMFNSVAMAVLQARSEHDMVGRLMSVMTMAFLGIFPIGGLALGLLSDLIGVAHALLISGLACLLTAAVLTAFPSFSRELIIDMEGG